MVGHLSLEGAMKHIVDLLWDLNRLLHKLTDNFHLSTN
jgi:hypothetical protein